MEAFLEQSSAVLSIVLFAVALIGTIYVGIRRIVGAQRLNKSALSAPRSDGIMLRQDYWNLFWWLFLTTLLVYATGVIAQIVSSEGPKPLWEHFFNAFQRTDAKNYIIIARDGYTAVGENRFFIVFFPLFPYLVRFFAVLFGGDFVVAAFVLNFILMYLAIVVMFRLGIMDFPKRTVYTAIGLMLLFPEAFFFHNPYNEPLFLLLSLLSMYFTRKDKYALAGLAGMLCAFTRAAGVLCAVPLVARSFIRAFYDGAFHPLQWLKKAVWSLLTLCGTGLYLLVNTIVTGNPFMFLVHQSEHWDNYFKLFPSAVGTITGRMLSNIDVFQSVLWISQFAAIFLFLGLLVIGVWKLSTEMSLYNCAYFFMMISLSWLLSAPRYLMVLFPSFFVLATVLDNKALRAIVMALFGIGLCVMTYLFCIGYCIY